MNRTPAARKGQGLSVNMIILVAIGLIILVITVLLVNRSGRGLSDSATTSCISKGGSCDKSACVSPKIALRDQYPDIDDSCTKGQENAEPQYCCRYDFGG